jgi:hypothetical protein
MVGIVKASANGAPVRKSSNAKPLDIIQEENNAVLEKAK